MCRLIYQLMLAKLGNYTFDGTTLEASLIMFVPVIRFNVKVTNKGCFCT